MGDANMSFHNLQSLYGSHFLRGAYTGADLQVLTDWYTEYMAAACDELSELKFLEIISSLKSDKLDETTIEERVRDVAAQINVSDGFCSECQNAFDHWPIPNLGSVTEVEIYLKLGLNKNLNPLTQPDSIAERDVLHKAGRQTAVARICRTIQVEASTRKGCRFCAFLLQHLTDTNLLDTFRKIEARLDALDVGSMISLLVTNWGPRDGSVGQTLRFIEPGKSLGPAGAELALDGGGRRTDFHSTIYSASGVGDDPMRDVGFKKAWRHIVQQYSQGHLSLEKDKLPALSGLARRTYNEHNSQYLAGMWRDEIEWQMCWKSETTTQQRLSWRAPTWSWTSVDAQVTMPSVFDYGPEESKVEYAHVVEADMILSGSDPFGQVSGGTLRLSCAGIIAGNVFIRNQTGTDCLDAWNIAIESAKGLQSFPIQVDCFSDAAGRSDDLAYVFPMFAIENGTTYLTTELEVFEGLSLYGIVLRRTNSTMGEFYRIGSFRFDNSNGGARDGDDDASIFGSFQKILGSDTTSTANAVCAEVIANTQHPKEKFVITLV
ncbi:MAG: hypothetical protein M1820_002951 [Bogoriella megaspora]|nr:MAG: hypothetical protein M1820_002951 [Bogoriella megaspora]